MAQQFENLKIEVKGNQVIITILDFTKEFGVSASGPRVAQRGSRK